MDPAPIAGGDITVGTIWLLIATALVIFMTPGLAFFYGGLVKAKSVVSMAMLSFGAMGIVSVLWVLYGFNIGFIAGELARETVDERWLAWIVTAAGVAQVLGFGVYFWTMWSRIRPVGSQIREAKGERF